MAEDNFFPLENQIFKYHSITQTKKLVSIPLRTAALEKKSFLNLNEVLLTTLITSLARPYEAKTSPAQHICTQHSIYEMRTVLGIDSLSIIQTNT